MPAGDLEFVRNPSASSDSMLSLVGLIFGAFSDRGRPLQSKCDRYPDQSKVDVRQSFESSQQGFLRLTSSYHQVI